MAAAPPPLSLSLSLWIFTVDAMLALTSKDAERPPAASVFFEASEPDALLLPPLLALAAAAFLIVAPITRVFAFAASLSLSSREKILCPSVHAARRLKDLDSSFVVYCALTLHAFGRLAAAAAAADDARHLFRVLSKSTL